MLVTLLIPPFAILLGALLHGERLSPGVYLGLGVITLGLLGTDGRLTARLRRRPKRRSKARSKGSTQVP